MPEEMILRHCSPTLVGIKTANMFSYKFSDKREMIDTLRKLNKIFASKGIRVVPLRTVDGVTLLYFFRPQKLMEDLKNETAREALFTRGYKTDNMPGCLVRLIEKLKSQNDFPHEIGFFLGYPPFDVACFIEGKKDYIPCKCCWRVYDNEDLAVRTYNAYLKCTSSLMEKHSNGLSLENLACAV